MNLHAPRGQYKLLHGCLPRVVISLGSCRVLRLMGGLILWPALRMPTEILHSICGCEYTRTANQVQAVQVRISLSGRKRSGAALNELLRDRPDRWCTFPAIESSIRCSSTPARSRSRP